MDESREALLQAGSSAKERASRFWDGFVDFALGDNVLEVAVGLILASAFTQVVNSLVSDVILPPISLLPFLSKNLDEKFAVLKHGEKEGSHYNTMKQALDDGAVVLAYGSFLEKVIRLLVVGLALYSIALTYQAVSKDNIIKETVKCKYCRKRISAKAERCVNCTSWQDGRDD